MIVTIALNNKETALLSDYNENCPDILTSFDKFIFLKTLITVLLSLSSGFALLLAPSVRRTESMFLKPKS